MSDLDIQQHLGSMSDDELRTAIETAKADLAQAATEVHGSEWHEACFAGLIIYSGEATKRGIILGTVH